MKKLVCIVLLIFAASAATAQGQHPLISDCSITKDFGMMSETFRLYGNVKVVTDPKEYADFRVKVVKAPGLAAVYVKKVTEKPLDCGEWRFVESTEKATFTVRFVTEMEHFTIRFVDSNPGSRY
jgi:hypothetical protein